MLEPGSERILRLSFRARARIPTDTHPLTQPPSEPSVDQCGSGNFKRISGAAAMEGAESIEGNGVFMN